MVSETLDSYPQLTWLVAKEDFIVQKKSYQEIKTHNNDFLLTETGNTSDVIHN
jgi:hypothetical protein